MQVLSETKITDLIKATVATKIIAGQSITPQDWIDFARKVESAALEQMKMDIFEHLISKM